MSTDAVRPEHSVQRSALSEARTQPWRNGGGSTRELLAWPLTHGQSHAWQLRVSVAQITQDGPFSAFAGVDRCFAVLTGAGVLLHVKEADQSRAVRLDRDSAPLAFPGEQSPHCELIDGPTADLNLMVRRGLGLAQMWRSSAQAGISGSTRWRGVYAQDAVSLLINGKAHQLDAHTLLWDDSADTLPWLVQGSGAALCLAVR